MISSVSLPCRSIEVVPSLDGAAGGPGTSSVEFLAPNEQARGGDAPQGDNRRAIHERGVVEATA